MQVNIYSSSLSLSTSIFAFSTWVLAKSNVTVYVFKRFDGVSYIGSIMIVSTIERNPRAPSLYSTALSTT